VSGVFRPALASADLLGAFSGNNVPPGCQGGWPKNHIARHWMQRFLQGNCRISLDERQQIIIAIHPVKFRAGEKLLHLIIG
jgi:hypothetical protein